MSFQVGDRVEINYGPGTVVEVIGEPVHTVVVHADVGQAWFRDVSDVRSLEGPDPAAIEWPLRPCPPREMGQR